eukprot:scaffold17229_cov125-Skeletonema_dohrnii-CCMP3373.AAC.1
MYSRYCVDNQAHKPSNSIVSIDMSPRVPSTAALLPQRLKKAKHPIGTANEKSRYCVDNQAHKPSNSRVSIDMSPRVPSTAALLPHRLKKAKHPIGTANEKR